MTSATRCEHSIEFQTVFLHHYLKGTPIVPILCGGIHEFLFAKQSPFEDGRFMGFVESIREQTTKRGKVLFVAGVDFSHVGLKFGDGMPADSILDVHRPTTDSFWMPCWPGMGGRFTKMPPEQRTSTRSAACPPSSCWRSSCREKGESCSITRPTGRRPPRAPSRTPQRSLRIGKDAA